ncbi:MAG: alpha/beta fold hydrolase [Flavobacteriaceae bacterium]
MKKKLIHLLSFVVPNIFVSIAYKNLTTPRIHKLRPHEAGVLNKAIDADLPFGGFTIKTYEWGTGSKSVLLVHGWEGQAGNFADLIELLINDGFTVYAFDGPGHGASSKGGTSLFEFNKLVVQLIKTFKVDHLVSHSFGGVASSIGLGMFPEIKIKRFVLFTTPNKLIDRIQFVAETIGVSNRVTKRLIKKIEFEEGIIVGNMNVADYVQKASVEKALILHDIDDKILPIEQSKEVEVAWKEARLEEIKGTGHYRILRTNSVLQKALNFLNS